MPAPVQERYNVKARGSVAGGSAHKKRKRPKVRPEVDGNGEEVRGESSKSVHQTPQVGRDGMSSKKRKRLDSYIAKKLKSESRLSTLQLLASLAPSAPTSSALLSSSTLGQNPFKPSSAKERFEKREDKLVRRGIHKVSQRNGGIGSSNESDSESEEDTRGNGARRKGKGRAVEVIVDAPGHEDIEGVIETTVLPSKAEQKAKAKAESRGDGRKRMPKKAEWNPNLLPTQPNASSSSDFDSSDSANDSSEDEQPQIIASTSRLPSPVPSKPGSPDSKDKGSVDLQTVPARIQPRPLSTGLGGALKRSATGEVVQPKVEPARKGKKLLGRNIRIRKSARVIFEDEDLNEGSDSDDSDAEDNDEDDDEGGDGDSDEDEDVSESEADSGDEEDSAASSIEEEPLHAPTKKRALGFKDWALKQMSQPTTEPKAVGPDLSSQPSRRYQPPVTVGNFVGPLGEALVIPTSSLLDQVKSKARVAPVSQYSGAPETSASGSRPILSRRPSVSEARMELPILAEEQSIMEAILMHPVVVICGETGSGKTTQVPQMLYEAGFGFKGSDNPGMIAVTQPRRVAAVSLAVRVKSELNLPTNSSVVAHQIRYSTTTSPETSIKFMTDGVLLRELASDFLLSRYSVIVVDEAHERGVNTDVLVGVLSRVAKLREKLWRDKQSINASKSPPSEKDGMKPDVTPLRIVIMSATLRVSDFAENPTLFPSPPPVIQISARQHPVTVHFSRRTTSDYVTGAYKKVVKIHSRLPPGGILVFMTGQSEIQGLCRKLEKVFGGKKSGYENGGASQRGGRGRNGNNVGHDMPKEETREVRDEEPEVEDLDLGYQDDLAADVDDGAAESDPEGLDSDDDGLADLAIDEASDVPMHILPLYSLLPNDQQMRVFSPPPGNARLVIISTNVAETSLTIPGIRYVVDSGRAKERHFDPTNGVQAFQVSWISKASASQRAGRAGRTGPGHCYRLYSSALYEDHFEAFSKPEILRMPIEGVVLTMKSMNIDAVINFPFPTPPDRGALKRAEDLLSHLGALEQPTNTRMIKGIQYHGSVGGRITDLGKQMAGYPVSPRFAKMLVIGKQHDCLPYVVAIVACLSVGDPFFHESTLEMDDGADEEMDIDKALELKGIRNAEVREKEERKEVRRKYFKAHQQFMALGGGASDMFKMLAAVGAYEYEPSPQFCQRNFLRTKAMQEIHQLRGQISTIAKLPRAKLLPPSDIQLKVLRQILTAGFIDQVAIREDLALKKSTSGNTFDSTRGIPYRAAGLTAEKVYIHPSSTLFHRTPPDFLVFQEVVRNSNGKTWLKGITKINPVWLAELGKSQCSFSRPLEGINGKGKFGGGLVGGDRREVYVTPHFRDLGVDLPVVKRFQRREGTRWVMVE